MPGARTDDLLDVLGVEVVLGLLRPPEIHWPLTRQVCEHRRAAAALGAVRKSPVGWSLRLPAAEQAETNQGRAEQCQRRRLGYAGYAGCRDQNIP
jgi:hypothetical protein